MVAIIDHLSLECADEEIFVATFSMELSKTKIHVHSMLCFSSTFNLQSTRKFAKQVLQIGVY